MDGKLLQKLRKKRGLTQEELADKTGIPKGTIGRIEASGEPIAKAETLTILLNFFKNEADGDILGYRTENKTENTQSVENDTHLSNNIRDANIKNTHGWKKDLPGNAGQRELELIIELTEKREAYLIYPEDINEKDVRIIKHRLDALALTL